MFAEPPPTRYDLNFRLLGVPVRVHPLFWLVTALLGGSRLGDPPEYLLIWVGVVFVSILVHELGHVAAFRWCGRVRAHVVLYGFGGLAVPWGGVDGRGRRVVVALAGPAAGFVLAGLVWGSDYLVPWAATSRPAVYLFVALLWVNLAWGVVNLLPVFPLDGGRVSDEVCGAAFGPGRGRRVALEVSVAVAGVIVVFSLASMTSRPGEGGWLDDVPWWLRGSFFTALMFGVLAYQSYQLLQQSRWTDRHWDDDRRNW